MRAGLKRISAVVAVSVSALCVVSPAFAGGDGVPLFQGHPQAQPVYSAPHYGAPQYHSPEQGLRTRPHYWFRPRVDKIADKEIVPSCYLKRERIWLDRYTYTHKYHRHCD